MAASENDAVGTVTPGVPRRVDIRGRRVWGFGGPTAGTGSHDGQSALKLHRGISVIAFLLCVLVVVVFLMDHVIAAAIVFAIIALACAGIFVWTTVQLRGADD